MSAAVAFTPLDLSHRPLLAVWVREPHVRQWWPDAEEHLDSFFEPDENHDAFIAHVNGTPLAYVQCWKPTQNPHYPWQHDLPATVRGIDLFIGPPDRLEQGLGSFIVKHFATRLFAEGATRLVIDPDLKNERAIAAYMKAGFTPYDEADDSLLMELLPEDVDYAGDHA